MRPLIQEKQIRARANQQSYSRGERYFRSKAIFATVRRGHEIEGRCHGSRDTPYHVSATLDDGGNIEDASCTCEYTYGGDCKHIVALLLTYLHAPGDFVDLQATQETLTERSKDELLALIEQMVARYPDLKTLIDRPVPRPVATGKVVDVTPFRHELQNALGHFDQWGDSNICDTVNSVADAARAFADAGQWHSASAIYRTILEETTNEEHYPADDEGELIEALDAVVEAAVACLEQAEIHTDEQERRALLDRLVDVYIWDINLGGYGLGDLILPDAILQHLRPEDISGIRERVLMAQRRRQKSEYGQWGVEIFARFLMQLDALDSTDDETTLQRLREQGLYRLVFEKLLALGRIDEALGVASKHLTNAYDRFLVLPSLLAVGRGDDAIQLAEASLQAGFDDRVAHWLAKQYQANGNHKALYELQLLCMKSRPSVDYYAALKQAAEAVGTWATTRTDILKWLDAEETLPILTYIYLHDEEWDAAWETLARIKKRKPQMGWAWIGLSGIELEVATKSKDARPQRALPVFLKYAREQIDGRTRGHYHQAAGYLAVVRDLYQKLQDESAWQLLITEIREEFRRLPALQDELNQAGL